MLSQTLNSTAKMLILYCIDYRNICITISFTIYFPHMVIPSPLILIVGVVITCNSFLKSIITSVGKALVYSMFQKRLAPIF